MHIGRVNLNLLYCSKGMNISFSQKLKLLYTDDFAFYNVKVISFYIAKEVYAIKCYIYTVIRNIQNVKQDISCLTWGVS